MEPHDDVARESRAKMKTSLLGFAGAFVWLVLVSFFASWLASH